MTHLKTYITLLFAFVYLVCDGVGMCVCVGGGSLFPHVDHGINSGNEAWQSRRQEHLVQVGPESVKEYLQGTKKEMRDTGIGPVGTESSHCPTLF